MENKDNGMEIDLTKIAAVLLENIVFIVLCMVIFGGIFFFVSKEVLPEKFTTSASMYVTNSNKNQRSTDDIMIGDITASQKLVETYSVILKNDIVMDVVGDDLVASWDAEELGKYFTLQPDDEGKLHIKSGQVANCVSFAAVNETEVLKVSVTTGNPVLSRDICKLIIERAQASLTEIMGVANVSKLADPKIPTSRSYPNNKKNALLGVLVGMLLSCGFVVLKHLMSNVVTDGESITSRFDLPILAEIPGYENEKKGGSR
ncbi:MAG: hypothetical protein IJS61_03280 [Firmicutes bacterium]|nr:hypothetical protein [Bacillota bacterium]